MGVGVLALLCDTFLRRTETGSVAFLLRVGGIAPGCGTDPVVGSEVVSLSDKFLPRTEIGSVALSDC